MSRQSFWIAAWRLNRTVPLVLLGLLAGNIALFVLLTLIVYPRTDGSERSLAELQRSLRSQGRAITPEQALTQATKDLRDFRALLPDARELGDLIGEIHGLAGQSNLQIKQIGYTPKELPAEEMLSYGLSFGVTGSYGALKRFIHGLESSRRIVVIEKLSLDTGGATESDEEVSLQIDMTTYFRREANHGS